MQSRMWGGVGADLLCKFVLWSVLKQQLEYGERRILVQSLCEAIQCRRDLEPLSKYPPLPLNTHILWPLDKPVHVLLGRWVVSNTCITEEFSKGQCIVKWQLTAT